MDSGAAQTHVDDGVYAWQVTWRVLFFMARRTNALMRVFRGLPLPSTSQIVELRLVGRKSGKRRDVLVGMSRIDGRMYVGHPNGPTAWLANLAATDVATLQVKHQPPIRFGPWPLCWDPSEKRPSGPPAARSGSSFGPSTGRRRGTSCALVSTTG